jgi:hypothetical protein
MSALLASRFGFANREAKDETGGFFLGFRRIGTWWRSTPGCGHGLYGS